MLKKTFVVETIKEPLMSRNITFYDASKERSQCQKCIYDLLIVKNLDFSACWQCTESQS